MGARGLGIGIVWWPPLDPLCSQQDGLVDVIELEPEAFWIAAEPGDGFRSFLAGALEHLPQPKLLHGVGAPLGGTCGAPQGHLQTFAADVSAVCPEYVSEHLSISRFRGGHGQSPVSAGLLLPPLSCHAGMIQAVENVRQHRAAFGIPLAIETPVNYLPPMPGEWPDSALIAHVAETADCGILLDLHNVLCNARNGRQSAVEYCNGLPLERVWELHLAGGETESSFYLDAHSGLVEPELMEIASGLVPRLPNLQSIIFEIMPERISEVGLAAVAQQLGELKALWRKRSLAREFHRAENSPALPCTKPLIDSVEEWERLLGCAVNGMPLPAMSEATANWWRGAEPAVAVYRKLVGEGRASAVTAAAPVTTRLLLQQLGPSGTRKVLAEFWRQTPPAYTSAQEAEAFFQYLVFAHPTFAGLADAMASDTAELVKARSFNRQIAFT